MRQFVRLFPVTLHLYSLLLMSPDPSQNTLAKPVHSSLMLYNPASPAKHNLTPTNEHLSLLYPLHSYHAEPSCICKNNLLGPCNALQAACTGKAT